ncbi:MAG: DUF554 family protein, partial [Clostridia bacterium]|nr:DUF554 family protein [Clostridia bacterium]
MPFLGTIVNFLAVLVCGLLGMLVKRGVPKRISDALTSAMAICVIYIGVDGMLEAAPALDTELISPGLFKVLVMVISIGLGTLMGELVDIEKELERLTKEKATIESEIKRAEGKLNNQGFVAKAPQKL